MHFSCQPMESKLNVVTHIHRLSCICALSNISFIMSFLSVMQKTKNKTPWSSFSMALSWQKEDMRVCVLSSFCQGNNQHEFCTHSLASLCLGKTLCNIEQFGQYPLQVNGFNNLDECLEGAMVEREIESLHSDHSVTPGREVNYFINWLTVELLCIWLVQCLCKLMLH